MVVVNDGDTPERERVIREMCEQYAIPCIRYNQEDHENHIFNKEILSWQNENAEIRACNRYSPFDVATPNELNKHAGVRVAHLTQFILERIGYNHDDNVVLTQADVFPIREFTIGSLIEGNDIVSTIYPFGARYPMASFLVMNMPSLPNKNDLLFKHAVTDPLIIQEGAHMCFYLRRNPEVRCKLLPWEAQSVGPDSFKFEFDGLFLHGTGSCGAPKASEKVRNMFQFIIDKIHDTITEDKQKHDIWCQYMLQCGTPSNIYETLPDLRRLAQKCSTILEIGMHSMNSTWALLTGLSEGQSDTPVYLGIDSLAPATESWDRAKSDFESMKGKRAQAHYISTISDNELLSQPVDLLFFREGELSLLEQLATQTQKYIAFIDIKKECLQDFLNNHPEWQLKSETMRYNRGVIFADEPVEATREGLCLLTVLARK